jgi:hypothetical protein
MMGHNEGKARDIRGTGGGTYEGHTNLDSYGTRMGHVRDTGTRKGHVRDTGTRKGHVRDIRGALPRAPPNKCAEPDPPSHLRTGPCSGHIGTPGSRFSLCVYLPGPVAIWPRKHIGASYIYQHLATAAPMAGSSQLASEALCSCIALRSRVAVASQHAHSGFSCCCCPLLSIPRPISRRFLPLGLDTGRHRVLLPPPVPDKPGGFLIKRSPV